MPRSRSADTLAGAPNVPMRLRKRRDGSMCLADSTGKWDSAERVFPSPHIFNFPWLFTAGAGIARVEGQELKVELANARATYQVERQTTAKDDGVEGVLCTLTSTELFDAPAIDEAVAETIAAQVAADREATKRREARELLGLPLED